MRRRPDLLCHLVALTTVAVWGTTFVWTKLLIISGISPAQIFTLRFAAAYVLLLSFSLATGPRGFRLMAGSVCDELMLSLIHI